MDDIAENKNVLRQEALRQIARIDTSAEDPQDAVKFFADAVPIKPDMVVSAYWPMGREFDCRPIIELVLSIGAICALPVVQKGDLVLRFGAWSDGDALEKSNFGVMEPVVGKNTKWLEPDIVIVPMLAFDRRGIRLGRGGGYYDATLNDLRSRKDVLAVGVAYAQQACLFNLPAEPHDARLDWVITPQGTHYYEQ